MEFCQSCGMPMEDKTLYGHDSNGDLNKDYCKYCYENGEFAQNCTMEEMIETCIPFMAENGMPPDEARKILTESLPKLKRWC